MAQQSANQLWKAEKRKGLTSLDFKTWLNRKKAMNFRNVSGTDATIQDAEGGSLSSTITELHQLGGLQTQAGTQYIFGINRTALIWTGVGLGLLATGILIYKLTKKR